MKATGIVRRIDDLGRVVIPKEIRRSLQLHEGDPVEIYLQNRNEIVLKKYSALSGMKELADKYIKVLGDTILHPVAIVDHSEILAASSSASCRVGSSVTQDFAEFVDRSPTSNSMIFNDPRIKLSDDSDVVYQVYPICTKEDGRIGAIVVFPLSDIMCDKVSEIATIARCLAAEAGC